MCNACDTHAMEWALFAGIPGDDVRAVLSLARRATYRRGEVVFHRYDPADSLHLVVKGRFDVRITTQLGDVVALGIHGPGATFGELAVVDRRRAQRDRDRARAGRDARGARLGAPAARAAARVGRRGARPRPRGARLVPLRAARRGVHRGRRDAGRPAGARARAGLRLRPADRDPAHPGGHRGARRHVARDRQPGPARRRLAAVSSSCAAGARSCSSRTGSPGWHGCAGSGAARLVGAASASDGGRARWVAGAADAPAPYAPPVRGSETPWSHGIARPVTCPCRLRATSVATSGCRRIAARAAPRRCRADDRPDRAYTRAGRARGRFTPSRSRAAPAPRRRAGRGVVAESPRAA